MEPEILHHGLLDMQVCVPDDWQDEQVIAFAEKEYECGTSGGWQIREEGNEALKGDPERAPCADRSSFVHIMLDA